MIERPTNDETFQQVRQRVLEDLQEQVRRARSLAPVVSADDLTILRNIVRPALDQSKVGSAGRGVLADSPLVALLVKHAAEDLPSGGDYLGSQWGKVTKSIEDTPPGWMTPEMARVLRERGADVPAAWTAERPSGILATIGGVFEPLSRTGGALYDVGKGLLGGALGSASPEALAAVRGSSVGQGIDTGARWVAEQLPTIAATGGAGSIGAAAKGLGLMGGIETVLGTAPWSSASGPPAVDAAPAVEPSTAGASESSPDLAGLFNQRYWGGGRSLPGAQGFAQGVSSALKDFDPSTFGAMPDLFGK